MDASAAPYCCMQLEKASVTTLPLDSKVPVTYKMQQSKKEGPATIFRVNGVIAGRPTPCNYAFLECIGRKTLELSFMVY